MKYLLIPFLFVIFALPAQARYNYEKQGNITLDRENIFFKVLSPSCWANDGQAANCPNKLTIYIADSTNWEHRKAYSINLWRNGLVRLNAESQPGKFNWKVFEGKIPDDCLTDCFFAIPANLVKLEKFRLWRTGGDTSTLKVNGQELPAVNQDIHPYFSIENPYAVENNRNPFKTSKAEQELFSACVRSMEHERACLCLSEQIVRNRNNIDVTTRLHKLNPVLTADLYETLTSEWWARYMDKDEGSSDLKAGSILTLSLNAGMTCAELESRNRPPQSPAR